MEKIVNRAESRRHSVQPRPEQVAAGLVGGRDFVWLDTAQGGGAEGESVSILAVDPETVIAGDISSSTDWAGLREVLRERVWADPESGAAAIGSVDFEGAFRFAFYPCVLRYHHHTHTWHGAEHLLEKASDSATGAGTEVQALDAQSFRPMLEQEDYVRMVRAAKEYIAAGDIYQVNLSRRFDGPVLRDAFGFYGRLRQKSPAPMAAYLAQGERRVLSSSMETFLQMTDRRVLTKPIKGTRPRGATMAEDEVLWRQLRESTKERAELVMITDLERNDLGQFCEFGSVQVERLLEIEEFAQVFHQSSTVTGRIRDGIDHAEALRFCYPGGSITGAPKKRAIEIIRELEPTPRGLYTGTIGYFGSWGTSGFNIVIRTLVAEPGGSHFHVGAGIVADSGPEAEYAETLHKARGLLQSAESYGAGGKKASSGGSA